MQLLPLGVVQPLWLQPGGKGSCPFKRFVLDLALAKTRLPVSDEGPMSALPQQFKRSYSL